MIIQYSKLLYALYSSTVQYNIYRVWTVYSTVQCIISQIMIQSCKLPRDLYCVIAMLRHAMQDDSSLVRSVVGHKDYQITDSVVML